MECNKDCKACSELNEFRCEYCCLLECNEHEFCEGCDKGINSLGKYIEGIDNFLSFIRKCQEEYNIYKSKNSDSDNATQDILHYIELILSYADNDNIVNSNLINLLKKTRIERRNAKDHLASLDPIISWISSNTRTINDLQKLLGDVRKVVKNSRNRFYNNKTNVLDTIKDNEDKTADNE